MKVLVIGGTLFIGRRLVADLLKQGHQVTVLHRRKTHTLGKKVENLAADRNDGAALRKALDGRRFDAVFDNVYDWERGTTAAHVEATVQACGDRISRYIFMSSVAAYGDGLNHYEDDPLAPDDHPDAYVRNKAMSERMLFRLHQRTGYPVVTFRPPFVYIRDLVEACVKALTETNVIGHAFNIGNERPITQLELVQALARAGNKKPQIARVPRERIIESGGNPMGDPAYFGHYLDVPPITEAIGKVKRMLKLTPTPFDEGLKETYRWYLRNFKSPRLKSDFEDKLIALGAESSGLLHSRI